MIVLAIDPGPKETAWAFLSEEGVIWRPKEWCPLSGKLLETGHDWLAVLPLFGKVSNLEFIAGPLTFVSTFGLSVQIVLEKVEHYGKDMHAGETTFETVFWSGRFIQHYLHLAGEDAPWHRMGRREVKHILAGSARAKDGDIRTIVRDRLGPKGTRKEPGPTWGVTADVWQALGLGLAFLDAQKEGGGAAPATSGE